MGGTPTDADARLGCRGAWHDWVVAGHGQPGQLALVLAAVEGGLEEAPEVAECLLAFFFHYLLADDRVTSLAQGAAGS